MRFNTPTGVLLALSLRLIEINTPRNDVSYLKHSLKVPYEVLSRISWNKFRSGLLILEEDLRRMNGQRAKTWQLGVTT